MSQEIFPESACRFSLRKIQSLNTEEVFSLLDAIGYEHYRPAFGKAKISGEDLDALQCKEELEELGINMPTLKFRVFMKKLSEVF